MANIQGATDFGPEVLKTVVGEFVEAIQQGGNQFADDGSIPDVIRSHVINRTRWMWLCEFPALKLMQTPVREKLNEEAEKFRDAVAAGNPKIAPPPNPVNAAATLVTMPSVGRSKLRRFRWEREDGI